MILHRSVMRMVRWGALWESDRPGGDPSNHALTVQAAPGWSIEHLEDKAADVARALPLAWQDASGQTAAHRR